VCVRSYTAVGDRSAGQLAQEFLLVHVVLEGFSPIDEDDRNFIVKLSAELEVRIDIDFTPGKASTTRELRETLFYNFAQMTALAGIHHDCARVWHAGEILARKNRGFQQ
jgi:hypothetical protein